MKIILLLVALLGVCHAQTEDVRAISVESAQGHWDQSFDPGPFGQIRTGEGSNRKDELDEVDVKESGSCFLKGYVDIGSKKNDLQEERMKSADSCRKYCVDTNGCTHAVYGTTSGTCYLKKGKGNPQKSKGFVYIHKKCSPKGTGEHSTSRSWRSHSASHSNGRKNSRGKSKNGKLFKLEKRGHECGGSTNSKERYFGKFKTLDQCAKKCKADKKCKTFIYGYASRKGKCYDEGVSFKACEAGKNWVKKHYNFYSLKKETKCTRPKNWCKHGVGATYEYKDCDGDGIPDHVCSDPKHFGVIQSSKSCKDSWPNGLCIKRRKGSRNSRKSGRKKPRKKGKRRRRKKGKRRRRKKGKGGRRKKGKGTRSKRGGQRKNARHNHVMVHMHNMCCGPNVCRSKQFRAFIKQSSKRSGSRSRGAQRGGKRRGSGKRGSKRRGSGKHSRKRRGSFGKSFRGHHHHGHHHHGHHRHGRRRLGEERPHARSLSRLVDELNTLSKKGTGAVGAKDSKRAQVSANKCFHENVDDVSSGKDNLLAKRTVSLESCRLFCHRTRGCKHAVYAKASRTCWLKTGKMIKARRKGFTLIDPRCIESSLKPKTTKAPKSTKASGGKHNKGDRRKGGNRRNKKGRTRMNGRRANRRNKGRGNTRGNHNSGAGQKHVCCMPCNQRSNKNGQNRNRNGRKRNRNGEKRRRQRSVRVGSEYEAEQISRLSKVANELEQELVPYSWKRVVKQPKY